MHRDELSLVALDVLAVCRHVCRLIACLTHNKLSPTASVLPHAVRYFSQWSRARAQTTTSPERMKTMPQPRSASNNNYNDKKSSVLSDKYNLPLVC